MVYGNGNLHITGLTMGDRGVYTCKAVNSLGEASASTTMEITSLYLQIVCVIVILV